MEPGTIPYPSMSNLEVTDKVLEGYRLSKPKKCSSDIYQILLSCWKENPEERPEFSEVKEITNLLNYRSTQD